MATGEPIDFGYFLQRKYAQLQQQADAGTAQAASGTVQANANALVAGTTAKLNTTQNALLPGESASQNALRAAQARLANTESSLRPAESAANIGRTIADTNFTNVQGLALGYNRATPTPEFYAGTASPTIDTYRKMFLPTPAAVPAPFRLSTGATAVMPRLNPGETMENGVRVFRG